MARGGSLLSDVPVSGEEGRDTPTLDTSLSQGKHIKAYYCFSYYSIVLIFKVCAKTLPDKGAMTPNVINNLQLFLYRFLWEPNNKRKVFYEHISISLLL